MSYEEDDKYRINYDSLDSPDFKESSDYDAEVENEDEFKIDYSSFDDLDYKNIPDNEKNVQKEFDKLLNRFEFLGCVPFILAGAVFFIVGAVGLISTHLAKKNCTELVEGEVIQIKKWDHSSSDDDDESYAPIFRYNYKGFDYVSEGHIYSEDLDLRKGERVDVYVDPKDPSNTYIPAYKNTKNDYSFFIIGLGIAVIPTYIMIKRRRSEKKWYKENS